jgi:hypothetical protein
MNTEVLDYFQRLQADVQDLVDTGVEEGGGPYSENAFSELIIEGLESIGEVTDAHPCFFEGVLSRGVSKINGYSLDADEGRLALFVTVYSPGQEVIGIDREDLVKAGDQCVRFFVDSCNGYHTRMEPAGDAYDIAASIKDEAQNLGLLKVYLLTNGSYSGKPMAPQTTLGTKVEFDVWDINRLYRCLGAEESKSEIRIDLEAISGEPLPCLPMPQLDEHYTGYLTVIPGNVLYKLYEDFGPRLLELNVRSFLGVKGNKTVNSGLRKTLKEEPSNFMAFNNGIVVTADELELVDVTGKGKAIRAITGLQIVNGGQTTASIHRAKKIDRTDLSSVFVPAKIAVITRERLESMVERISHFANSQNTIHPADFSANEPFHVQMEQLSRSTWCPDGRGRWFYERARGSYQVAQAKAAGSAPKAKEFKEQTPPARRITKPELAKYSNAWDQKPYLVAFGSQKNFDHFMQELRKGRAEDWGPDTKYFKDAIAKAILFRAATKVVNQEKFSAYKANITAYLVACLSWKTGQHLGLDLIWRAQGVSMELTDVLRTWSHQIDETLRRTANGKMVSEWAKKEECWRQVREEGLRFPAELPPEIGRSGVTEAGGKAVEVAAARISPDDLRFIQACKAIDGPLWLRIHAWGKKSGQLEKWQYGIAHTLAGYAASDWEKEPSVKQAKHGVVIVELARQAGIIG